MPSERLIRHTTPAAVQRWIDEQRGAWQERSRLLGGRAADQSHPCITLHYTPAQTHGAPLLLLGGMGPLAGLEGLELALTRDPQREIVFHQACTLPCRSAAIAAETRGDPQPGKAVLGGLRFALDKLLAPLGPRSADLLVLCNGAHHFLPRLGHRLPPRIRLHPLPYAGVNAARRLAPHRIMILATEGARLAGLYARAAEATELRWCEPDPEERRLLQRAIFRGIKGGDPDSLHHDGVALVEHLANRNEPVDALLAGCTEVPLLLSALRQADNRHPWLEQVTLIDPVVETLNSLTLNQPAYSS